MFYGGGLHQLGVQALGLVTVGAFTFAASFGILWLFKVTIGIRTEEHVETAGLDVSEHGMWGYPEFYIPVPGGYGTETHGHMGLAHAQRPAPAATAATRSRGRADELERTARRGAQTRGVPPTASRFASLSGLSTDRTATTTPSAISSAATQSGRASRS